MPSLTTRERVERTLDLQEVDRVPVYDLLRNDAAFAYFAGEPLPALRDTPETHAALHAIAARATGAMCDMTRDVGFGPVSAAEVTDGFGFVHRFDPFEKTAWIASRPFDDIPGAVAFLEPWLGMIEQGRRDFDPAACREQHHRSFLHTQALLGETVNLLAVQGVGLDDVRHRLGLELFAYVEADQPGLVSAVMEAITQQNIAICHAVADLALSPVVMTYGDIAYKQRLMHSPAWLRAEFFPRLARLNAAWHEHGHRILFHSDGYLMEVMDDLLDAGIDGLNPIETVAGMDLAEIRRRYGRRLFLTGGIDMSQLLSLGSPDEVREVCRAAIRSAYPGYFMGSTTEADNSCRLDNLLAMVAVAREPR
ncbi:MAG: hypothetical protein HYU66_02195 [Armatimonadetes bacterium]|nr:hypothetical protein [Armatimonadota bacterium]